MCRFALADRGATCQLQMCPEWPLVNTHQGLTTWTFVLCLFYHFLRVILNVFTWEIDDRFSSF